MNQQLFRWKSGKMAQILTRIILDFKKFVEHVECKGQRLRLVRLLVVGRKLEVLSLPYTRPGNALR